MRRTKSPEHRMLKRRMFSDHIHGSAVSIAYYARLHEW